MITQGLQPHVSAADEPHVYFLGLPTVIRASGQTTNGAFGLIEQLTMPAGFASPYHTHRLEDEAFYVLEGEVAFVCDGNWTVAGPGTYVFGPRNIPHGFKTLAPSRLLLLVTPAGFEQFVADLADAAPAPPDMARLMAVAAKYHVDIHGPLPEEPPALAGRSRSARDPEQLNRRWIQAFNERDWATEKTLLSPDFRAHVSGVPEPLGIDAWSGFMAAFTTAFPDARITIDECIADGDTVATRWRLTGTHRGEFQGIPPTGRAIAVAGLEFSRLVDGRFVEHWGMFDNLALLSQIGAAPA